MGGRSDAGDITNCGPEQAFKYERFSVPHKIKSFLSDYLLVVVSIVAALLFVEIGMRLVGFVTNIDYRLYGKELKNSDRLPIELFVPNYDLFGLRPYAQKLATTSDFSLIYRINSQGLRDGEHEFQKKPGIIRIAALGDSFTFGEGVEIGKRFTDIMGQALPNVEVINLGVPGYGLSQALLKFKVEGLRYAPDYAVVFATKVIIDRVNPELIKDNYAALDDDTLNGTTMSASSAYLDRHDPFFDKKAFLCAVDKSYVLSFLEYRYDLLILKHKLEADDRKVWADILAHRDEDSNASAQQNNQEPEPIDPVANAKILFKKFNELCKKNKVKLIVVNIDDFDYRMDYLRDMDPNIRYYDLSPALMNEAKKHRLHFVYDRHYNPSTHRFIGHEMADILKDVVRERR